MPCVHARSQMGDKAVELVEPFLGSLLILAKHVLCNILALVDLHRFSFVFAVCLVHVTEDEVHGSLDVVLAFPQAASCLLLRQAHAYNRVDVFLLSTRAGGTTSRFTASSGH